MAVYSVVLTNLHHVYKYQAEGFTVRGGVIAFIQIHMANKTNEVRKFCLDFDLRRFDTILIDPEGNISKSKPHIYMLFAGWEVRMVKNCDRGLENAGRRPRAALSRPRSQFFTIRTDP